MRSLYVPQQVWNMSVDGPAVGMEQMECSQLDEIVLDQSSCSMIAAGSPLGSPTSKAKKAGGNSADAISTLELGAAAASGSEQWALGAMPVRPGTLIPAKPCIDVTLTALVALTVAVALCPLRLGSAVCRCREARRQIRYWRGAHPPKGLTWLS
jgi:hypothetical protein